MTAHYEGKKLIVPELGKYPEAIMGENELRELMRSFTFRDYDSRIPQARTVHD